jgi:hypothetical protein
MPLLYWLLDATICNAFIIANELYPQQKGFHRPAIYEARDFRSELAWNLVIAGTAMMKGVEHFEGGLNPRAQLLRRHRNSGTAYCREGSELPPHRLDGGEHHQIMRGSNRLLCYYCRYKARNHQNAGKAVQTLHFCSSCSPRYPLCKACFKPFHSAQNEPEITSD